MNAIHEFGYDKERFPKLAGESFDCCICCLVVKNPKECTTCGNMFCQSCIDSWLLKRSECPNRCPVRSDSIRPIGKALQKIYNALEIKCENYDKCKKITSVVEIDAHEATCMLPECINFDICNNKAKPEFKDARVCDVNCLLLSKVREANGDWVKVHKEIQTFLKSYAIPSIGSVGNIGMPGNVGGKNTPINFKWDAVNIGTGTEVSADKSVVFLREAAYMFRTCIGDTGLMSGVHYWEIHADKRTENELKIGVATKKDFNYNSAFCDFEFGFAYYGLGQLRHGSNASGTQYGKRFKNEGALGVLLDMNNGTLSFSLNGEHFGVAYTSDALKKGPIYPAVSLLHCAGCKLVSGLPVPQTH